MAKNLKRNIEKSINRILGMLMHMEPVNDASGPYWYGPYIDDGYCYTLSYAAFRANFLYITIWYGDEETGENNAYLFDYNYVDRKLVGTKVSKKLKQTEPKNLNRHFELIQEFEHGLDLITADYGSYNDWVQGLANESRTGTVKIKHIWHDEFADLCRRIYKSFRKARAMAKKNSTVTRMTADFYFQLLEIAYSSLKKPTDPHMSGREEYKARTWLYNEERLLEISGNSPEAFEGFYLTHDKSSHPFCILASPSAGLSITPDNRKNGWVLRISTIDEMLMLHAASYFTALANAGFYVEISPNVVDYISGNKTMSVDPHDIGSKTSLLFYQNMNPDIEGHIIWDEWPTYKPLTKEGSEIIGEISRRLGMTH